MLLWQQQKLRKQSPHFTQLLIFSFLFHCIFLGWLFFVYHEPHSLLAFTIDRALLHCNEPVIFVSSPQKSSFIGTPKKVEPVKKASSPKVLSNTTKSTRTVVEHTQQKKVIPSQQQLAPINIPCSGATEGNQPLLDNQLAIEDGAMYRQYESLYAAIAQSWKPPLGVAQQCVCQITVYVARDGSIHKSVVDKSSGVLIYDVAARNALYHMKMPEWARGKSLTVSLRQSS